MKKILSVVFTIFILCSVAVFSACAGDPMGTPGGTSDLCINGHSKVADEGVAPSCTEPGLSDGAHCSVCNTVITEQKEIPALGHTVVTDEAVAPSCTESGFSEWTHCSVCNTIITEKKELPALGHTEVTGGAIAPSCTESGLSEWIRCSVCDTVITEQKEIPALGHTVVTVGGIAPSCTETGLSEGKRCSVCDTIITAQKELPALGHTVGEWTITISSTCYTPGERQKKCTVCNVPIVIESIPSSCSSNESVAIDLNGYSIVYKDFNTTNSFYLSQIKRLPNVLKSEAGLSVSYVADSIASNKAKEILIGLTSRPESKQALESIHGVGFTVQVIGDKIVIIGTDNTMTLAALNYFITSCLDGLNNATKMTITEYTLCNATTNVLATSGGSSYTFVLDNDLDRDPMHMFVSGSTDKMDYPVTLLKKLISEIASLTGSKESDYKQTTDTDQKSINGYEVLFGEVERADSKNFRSQLDADEYGFYITDKKVIIAAHNDFGLEAARDAFLAFYKYVINYYNGALPEGFQYKGRITNQGWVMDFPRPEGENITLYSSQHNNNNSIQMIYTGAGVNAQAFLAYCAKLEAAGYVIVTKNDNPGNTGSYFRTYKNTKTQHAIYVAFNAFKYKGVYAAADRKADHVLSAPLSGTTVNYNMRDYQPCIRIVSAPLKSAFLPSDEIANDTYNRATEKITESSVTAMRLYGGSVGMGYIIQLEDGSFFIIDGGNTKNDDSTVLYYTLRELYKKAHGKYPSEKNPIHIKAWLITHSHGDHYNVPADFLKKYASQQKMVTMDYLIGNFPEISSMYSVGSSTTTMGKSSTIEKLQGYVKGGFEYVKVHTGQVLYFENLKLEVVMTAEDHAPFRINNSNDTNTVTKLTIRSANKDTTWMVLGDSCIYQSRWLCAMWGGSSYNKTKEVYDNSYLKSDMVQLAHHGNIGCEIALYKTIQGEVLWFPHNSASYNSYCYSKSTSEWRVQVDRYVARTLKSIKYIFVSGWYNSSSTFMDYHDSITLQFTANGPNYSDIWGVNYRKSNSPVVSSVPFNSGTGKVVDSPVIKK